MKNNNCVEENVIKQIRELKQSKEINKLLDSIKADTINMGGYLVQSRIKSEISAVESINSNKLNMSVSKNVYKTVILTCPEVIQSFNSVETVVDLLGIRIITNTIDDMYTIAEYLNNKYNAHLVMDHLKNPIIGFEYRAIHMYFIIKVNDIEFDIPMEIQIKTYEMHHAWEAIHDTIYKNKNINLKDGCILLPSLFKIFELNAKVCKSKVKGEDVSIDFSAIDSIIEYNKELFEKHYLEIEQSCFKFAKSIYLDANRQSTIGDERLFEMFNKIRNEDNKETDSKLHICGDNKLEYATFFIATSKLEGKV